MSTTIEAICFDLDDTLWSCAPVIQRAERILQQWLTIHYPRITEQFSIEALRELRQQLCRQYPHLAHDLTTIRKMGLALAAEHVGYDPQWVEVAFAVFYQARNQVELYADVLPCLKKLCQQYRLGALTNGNADLQQIGIRHLFHFTLAAREVGVAKPHPAFFALACHCAKAKPEHIVYVGDDPISDIQGAITMGMRAVWLNRQQKVWTESYTPSATISSLVELDKLLVRWNGM